jgi:hypothetical protein
VNADHDFYGSRFPDDGGDVVTIKGIRFAADSLWIYLAGDAVRAVLAFLTSSRLRVRRLRGGMISTWHILALLSRPGHMSSSRTSAILRIGSRGLSGRRIECTLREQPRSGTLPKTRLWILGQVHTPLEYVVPAGGTRKIRVVW